jgi:hypothetical protein
MPAEETDLGLQGEGVERKKIKALDDALLEIERCFTNRKKWQDSEAAARGVAVELYHKHNLKIYRGPDEKLYQLTTLEKVKRAPEPDADED